MKEKVATNFSTLIVVLILVAGLGMFIFNNYTGASFHGDIGVTSLAAQCDDTDNNVDDGTATDSIYTKGNVKTRKSSDENWVVIREDICVGNVLHEGYCAGVFGVSTTVTCANGCSNGKCNPVSCIDNDDGIKTLIASSASGIMKDDADFLGVPPSTQSAKIYIDSCSGDSINEYYCSQGFVKKSAQTCGENGCSNGKCNAATTSASSGSSSGGSTTKYCQEEKPDNSIFIKAGARTKVGNGAWSSYTYDSCSGNVLTEYSCKYDHTIKSATITCDYGCSDGKCNFPPCTDPDPLSNYENYILSSGYSYAATTKSTTLGLMAGDSMGIPPGNQIKSYTDYCPGGDYDPYIKEYYCDSYGKVKSFIITCASGPGYPVGSDKKGICQDGKCKVVLK